MKPRPLTALAPLIAAATLLPMLAMAPTIKREFNSNRTALTELESKPFDSSAIASLTDWTHPGTLDASNTEGKVVVLAVVSAADPQSIMTISKLTRLKRDFQDQGIVIAAIHPDAGFELVNEKVIAGKITIPVARDAGGVFVAAMHTDDYPDLYIIDRAGNLRFADIDKREIKAAVKLLTSETLELASTNADLQAQGLEPEPAGGAIAKIAPELYENANWPQHNSNDRISGTKNIQGKPLPVPLGREIWVANKRSLEDKVLVLDFWATWCGPCKKAMPMLENLQDQNEGKLEIVGIGGSEDFKVFKDFVLKKDGNYAQLFDSRKGVHTGVGVRGIPHVVVISTDGIIRWQGNPLDGAFVNAVNMTIEADPMFANDI